MAWSRAALLFAFIAAAAACEDIPGSEPSRQVEAGSSDAGVVARSTDYIRVEMRSEAAAAERAVAMSLETDVLAPLPKGEYAVRRSSAAPFELETVARVRSKPELLALTILNGGETAAPTPIAAEFETAGEVRRFFGLGPTVEAGAQAKIVLVFSASLDEADSRRIIIGSETAADAATTLEF